MKPPSFEKIPERVVCLAPSITESMFDLGLGRYVVGITDYCVHPAGQLSSLARIGGPKTPDIERILQLKPELVIANQEESSREAIQNLMERGAPVWMTFPKTVTEMLGDLSDMATVFSNGLAHQKVKSLEIAVDWANRSLEEQPAWSYFCPIWQAECGDVPYWMTFNNDTYSHDVLSLFGGVNIFGERRRRYPLEADLGLGEEENPEGRDERYPCVTLDEILAGQPDVIIFPSEPYSFSPSERQYLLQRLARTPAVISNRIHDVDGSLIHYPGTRLGLALSTLSQLFN